MKPDVRLERLRDLCMCLPEVAVDTANHGGHAAYSVRNKIFAYGLDNHHGDGRVAGMCKAHPGVQGALMQRDARRFFVPPYVGPRGWIGVFLDVDGVDWDELADLVEQSYRMTASRRLVAALDEAPSEISKCGSAGNET